MALRLQGSMLYVLSKPAGSSIVMRRSCSDKMSLDTELAGYFTNSVDTRFWMRSPCVTKWLQCCNSCLAAAWIRMPEKQGENDTFSAPETSQFRTSSQIGKKKGKTDRSLAAGQALSSFHMIRPSSPKQDFRA